MGSVCDEMLCNSFFKRTMLFWAWHGATISHQTLRPTWRKLVNIWRCLIGNEITNLFPLLLFVIYYSESFCLGEVKIANALVLADRNVITVARREGGEAVCWNNCQHECRVRNEGMWLLVAEKRSSDHSHIFIIFLCPSWRNEMHFDNLSNWVTGL